MMPWFKSHSNSLLSFRPSCSSSGHRHPELCSYRKSRDVSGVTNHHNQPDLSWFTDMADGLFSFRNPWESLGRDRSLSMASWETIAVWQAEHRTQGSFPGKLSIRIGQPKFLWFFPLGILQQMWGNPVLAVWTWPGCKEGISTFLQLPSQLWNKWTSSHCPASPAELSSSVGKEIWEWELLIDNLASHNLYVWIS